MIDEFAKEYLHDDLRWVREALAWKLEGLSEYDIRRPLTATGTNLLGLVKHSATWEARYFGEVFGRPFPQPLPRWDDEEASGTDLWVTADETREEILDFYRRAREHADATIDALAIDAPGHVPWWPRPDVKLFNILVHILAETTGTPGTPTSCASSSTARSGPARRARPRRNTTRLTGRATARRSSGPPGRPIPSPGTGTLVTVPDDAFLATRCARYLGARPARVLFRSGHLSEVVAAELADGRQVVIKARPSDPRDRLLHRGPGAPGPGRVPLPRAAARPRGGRRGHGHG